MGFVYGCLVACNFGFAHLEHQFSILDKNVRAEEGGSVVREAKIVRGLPSAQVEEVEVVAPEQLETAHLFVVRVGLYVVVLRVPGHVFVGETLLPLGEHRRPEVHHQGLRLVDCFDSWVEF